MKQLLQLLVVILLAAFVLPSCNSSLSITKRRYNKGYFVQHNSGKSQVKKSPATTTREANHNNEEARQTTTPSENEEFRATDFVKNETEKQNVSGKKELLTATAASARSLSKSQKKELRAQAVELAVKHPVKAIRLVNDLVKDPSGDKALSLLWVVVVVILIVYLLGLLFEWGSGNNLIHILGIIALVLLILWLLRIL